MKDNWIILKFLETQKNFMASGQLAAVLENLLRFPDQPLLEATALSSVFTNEQLRYLEQIKNCDSEKFCFVDPEVKFTCYGDRFYPKAFYKMIQPPLALSYIGEPMWLNNPVLSVVGSRDPQPASLRWMENHLASFVNQQKVSLVSGGARGIDQYAHMISIREGHSTMAFLPSGLNQIYPAQFLESKKQIVDSGGCLISEYLPNQKMMKHLFHHRNRLISAISPMLLVVEAWKKSGSLMTGHHSLIHGRLVGAVPGHPDQICFQGCLELIHQGAQLISGRADLTHHYNLSVQEMGLHHQA